MSQEKKESPVFLACFACIGVLALVMFIQGQGSSPKMAAQATERRLAEEVNRTARENEFYREKVAADQKAIVEMEQIIAEQGRTIQKLSKCVITIRSRFNDDEVFNSTDRIGYTPVQYKSTIGQDNLFILKRNGKEIKKVSVVCSGDKVIWIDRY